MRGGGGGGANQFSMVVSFDIHNFQEDLLNYPGLADPHV